jgi:hypothetical protein
MERSLSGVSSFFWDDGYLTHPSRQMGESKMSNQDRKTCNCLLSGTHANGKGNLFCLFYWRPRCTT